MVTYSITAYRTEGGQNRGASPRHCELTRGHVRRREAIPCPQSVRAVVQKIPLLLGFNPQ